MIDIQFKFIDRENILDAFPLLRQVNDETPDDVLRERLLDMSGQNYKCLGIYDDQKLIGICGLWFLTRHYCGRTVEPDHVVIDKDYQGQGIGNQLFDWIFSYATSENLEASELNTYVENTRSHKFYYNLGYEIKGYHFVRFID